VNIELVALLTLAATALALLLFHVTWRGRRGSDDDRRD
jgi:hypothetical protein